MQLGALPEPMYTAAPKPRHNKHVHKEAPCAPRGPALDLVLELNGEWHGQEVTGGIKEPNSGGNVVYLSPAWVGRRTSGRATYLRIPVINEVNGVQAKPGWRLLTGVSVSF